MNAFLESLLRLGRLGRHTGCAVWLVLGTLAVVGMNVVAIAMAR